MEQNKSSILKSALELAVLYLPLLAISELIEAGYPWDTSEHYQLTLYLLPIVSGILSFCVLVSENPKTAVKKWTLSIPFTLILGLFLKDFPVRLANFLYPGYGHLSAGGGFALMVKFGIYSMMQGSADLLALCVSGIMENRSPRWWTVMQDLILPILCAVIFLAVLYLGHIMPSMESVEFLYY